MAEVFDIVVAGGGIMGLSCALHLIDEHPDLRIAIVDKPDMPGISSTTAAGILSPYSDIDEDSPLFHLARTSYQYYPEFLIRYAQGDTGGVTLDETGILLPLNGWERKRSERIVERTRQFEEVRKLSTEDLLNIEPNINLEVAPEAWWIPGALLNPRLLHECLHREARRRGILFFDSPIKQLHRQGNYIKRIDLQGHVTVNFETLILCTGAWSGELMKSVGIPLEIIPVKGHVVTFKLRGRYLKHTIHGAELILAPQARNRLFVGTTMEYVGFDHEIGNSMVEALCSSAAKYLPPLWEEELSEVWVGFRSKLPDSCPAIGWSCIARNLLYAVGHFRSGILLAPITGKMIAQSYTGEATVAHDTFAPARYAI